MGYDDVAVHLLQNRADPVLRDNRERRTFLDFAIVRGNWSFIHAVLSTIQELYNDEAYQAFVHLVVLQSMGSKVFDLTGAIRREHIPRVIRLCDNVNFAFNDSSRELTKNNLMHYAETVEETEALVSRGFNLFNQPNSDGRLAIHEARSPAWIRFCVEHGTAIDHVDAKGQTLLLVLISKLATLTAGQADTIRKIRCCLHLGASPRHSDECKCPCSPAGCSSSAFFATGFEDSFFSSVHKGADIFWVFEWQSILRDLHGEEVVKEFLLSFLRRIKFDELGMTHVCCHRGSGMSVECRSFIHDTGPKIADEDISDILEEEDEFIDILDQTMRELALKSVDDLQRYLLEILKDMYDQYLQGRAEERREILGHNGKEAETHDSTRDPSEPFLTFDYSVPRSMATYAVYVDLEYFGADDSASKRSDKDSWYSEHMRWVKQTPQSRPEHDPWYSRRMRWFKMITEVFGLSVDEIIKCVDGEIDSTRVDSGQHPGRRIKNRLVAVLQTDNS
ncbi:hypothetical protein Daus18300_013638 [Diaporthe australafricana]|uniref:Ankyrin repeat protein n=1 Tax=Diaporthe australafricana TaxID=127596 RepID=A0ABR3VYI8_9PEZI